MLLVGFVVHFWAAPKEGISKNEIAAANVARMEAKVAGGSGSASKAPKKKDTSKFLKEFKKSGELDRLLDRYYGPSAKFNYVNTKKFLASIDHLLPVYEEMFRLAEKIPALTGDYLLRRLTRNPYGTRMPSLQRAYAE